MLDRLYLSTFLQLLQTQYVLRRSIGCYDIAGQKVIGMDCDLSACEHLE